MDTKDVLLELRDLRKDFSGTPVLKGVSLKFLKGEVHGVLGENGAGKSTLIKIATGVYSPSGGSIWFDGRMVRIGSPLAAHKLGLVAVYQDVELVASFTVAQNIVLGNEPRGVLLSQSKIGRLAREILQEIGVTIDVRRLASTLTAAEMQMVTLATLFLHKYKLIVLDEPTARLSGMEVELLFKVLERLRRQQITIIYISHRLAEVKRICDRVTILRDGVVSAVLKRDEVSEERVTELMIDRASSDLLVRNPGYVRGGTVLEVTDLATDLLRPLSFAVRSGEVLGVTGPVGGGIEQIERALGGIGQCSGKIQVGGRAVEIHWPAQSRMAGIAVIPEDRRRQALFPNLTSAANIAMPVLRSFERLKVISARRLVAYADEVMRRVGVRPHEPRRPVKHFSGGNQQKIVIGKWVQAAAKVYLIAEPTAGVDVGAIKEIYEIILGLAREGAAVILISSSIKEILTLSARVMVIRDGQLIFLAQRAECDYGGLLSLTMGGRAATKMEVAT